MELTPQAIRSTDFKTVKRGYAPDEVDAFKDEVAAALEAAQGQATAMESRARAAVGRLQELSQQAPAAARSAAPGREAAPAHGVTPPAGLPVGDTEVISRTLLLAQRTADTAVAEARAEAQSVTSGAREEASRVVDSARSMAAKMIDEAKTEARRSKEDELTLAENEVQALLARRDFLLSDVDQLEQYIQAQRERLRDTAVELHEIVERVPGGLADMRRPLLSASAEPVVQRSAAPAAATPAATVAPGVDSLGLDADDDPMSLFASDDVPTGEVPLTAGHGITAEVPIITPGSKNDPFRIGGDELR